MTNKALRLENAMRGQAEAALRESEQRFRDFAETGSDWLWETGPDHRLTQISEHIHRLGVLPAKRLGYTRWEIAADHEEDDEKWRAHIAAHEAHAPFRDFVYSLEQDDGSRIYVKTSGKPVFDSAGRFQGYRGIGSDVTAEIQHRKAEKALRQAQTELAHVTRVTMLGELTASIVHEVNQPLASIATNGDAALRFIERDEPDIAEVQDAIGDMIKDCRRATEIIQRVRALCRKSDPHLVSLDLNELIEDTIRLVQRELRDQGITLQKDLCTAIPAVRGDRVEIQQVLINLVMNGMEAMAAVDRTRPQSPDPISPGRRSGSGCRAGCRHRDRRSEHRSAVQLVLHDQAQWARNGTFDLPLDHRSTRRETMGLAECRSRRHLPVHAPGSGLRRNPPTQEAQVRRKIRDTCVNFSKSLVPILLDVANSFEPK